VPAFPKHGGGEGTGVDGGPHPSLGVYKGPGRKGREARPELVTDPGGKKREPVLTPGDFCNQDLTKKRKVGVSNSSAKSVGKMLEKKRGIRREIQRRRREEKEGPRMP